MSVSDYLYVVLSCAGLLAGIHSKSIGEADETSEQGWGYAESSLSAYNRPKIKPPKIVSDPFDANDRHAHSSLNLNKEGTELVQRPESKLNLAKTRYIDAIVRRFLNIDTGNTYHAANQAYVRMPYRLSREDNVVDVETRDGHKLPWDNECSDGYTHCGGFFPDCCEGFVCLKPLTDWDKKNGMNRCWPHYFQDDDKRDTLDN